MSSSPKPTKSPSSIETRLALRANEHFIVDPIFPCGALHIITGPSGIGKSTWLLQLLYEWAHGRDVLGHKSNPCEWVYVSLDRSLADADRTLRRIGLGDWDAPIYEMKDVMPRSSRGRLDVDPAISQVAEYFPKAKLYIIEGLQGVLPNTGRGQSQNKAEQLWAMRLRDEVLDKGITIIATTHTPKSNEATGRKREAMLGSHSLIGAAGTIIHFAMPPVQDETPGITEPEDRIVSIMGHNFPAMYLHYQRGAAGQLVLDKQITAADARRTTAEKVDEADFAPKSQQLVLWLQSYPAGENITTKQIKAQAAELGITTESYLFRWITEQVNSCVLLKEGRGIYRKSAATPLVTPLEANA